MGSGIREGEEGRGKTGDGYDCPSGTWGLAEAKVGTGRILSPALNRTRECQLVTISTSRMPLMEARSLMVQASGLQTYLHWYTLEELF